MVYCDPLELSSIFVFDDVFSIWKTSVMIEAVLCIGLGTLLSSSHKFLTATNPTDTRGSTIR